MWIVGVGGDNNQSALVEFNEAVLINIFPTLAFILVAWLMARAGHAVLPTIAVGYVVWALCLGVLSAAASAAPARIGAQPVPGAQDAKPKRPDL